MRKTCWQKFYSALGFWHYIEHTDKGSYKVLYWCCLPYGKFYRKFDILRYKVYV